MKYIQLLTSNKRMNDVGNSAEIVKYDDLNLAHFSP